MAICLNLQFGMTVLLQLSEGLIDDNGYLQNHSITFPKVTVFWTLI